MQSHDKKDELSVKAEPISPEKLAYFEAIRKVYESGADSSSVLSALLRNVNVQDRNLFEIKTHPPVHGDEVLMYLLKQGVINIDSQMFGNTFFVYAVIFDRVELVNFVLQSLKAKNEPLPDITTFSSLPRRYSVEMLLLFKQYDIKFDVDAIYLFDGHGRGVTLLTEMLLKGNLQAVETLVKELGADPNKDNLLPPERKQHPQGAKVTALTIFLSRSLVVGYDPKKLTDYAKIIQFLVYSGLKMTEGDWEILQARKEVAIKLSTLARGILTEDQLMLLLNTVDQAISAGEQQRLQEYQAKTKKEITEQMAGVHVHQLFATPALVNLISKKVSPEVLDPRGFLVLGCGANCQNHPHDKWVSIGPSFAFPNRGKPDIDERIENVTDFTLLDKGIRNKFKIVFVENMAHLGMKTPAEMRMHIANFVDEDGALIFYGGWPGKMSDHKQMKLDLRYFINVAGFHILTMQDCSLADTLKVVRQDLMHGSNPDSLKELNMLEQEIKEIQKKHPNLTPLLVSVLADVNTYAALRKDRKLRNYFKDSEYDKFAVEFEKSIVEFSQGKVSAQDILNQVDQWMKALPSTDTPEYKAFHRTLRNILNNCKDVVSNYFAPQQDVKPQLGSP